MEQAGFGADALRAAVLSRFPELAGDVEEGDGIHIVFTALERLAMAAIERKDGDGARAVLRFVDELLDQPQLDGEIPNAMAISFVEPSEMRRYELGAELWDTMPLRLRYWILQNENSAER